MASIFEPNWNQLTVIELAEWLMKPMNEAANVAWKEEWNWSLNETEDWTEIKPEENELAVAWNK